MKLERILEELNSFEKNSFLKILDNIIEDKPKKEKEVEVILSQSDRDLKNIDSINIVAVFQLVEDEFKSFVLNKLSKTNSQFDVLIDMISRDGNCIMKYDWFSRLYEEELKKLKRNIKKFNQEIENEKSDIPKHRKRDYLIYRNCVNAAYNNDVLKNNELQVTDDESSVLRTLADSLDLSHEEVKLLNYSILPLTKKAIDDVIAELKNTGVLFYSKKNNIIYVPDELVRLLRLVRNKPVADKHFRRVLRQLREPQINLVCKSHGIDWKQDLDKKIKSIINEGVSFRKTLSEDIFKEDTKVSDKKKFVNELCDKKLLIHPSLRGVTLYEKLDNLIKYFDDLDKEDRIGISLDGFERLLQDLKSYVPKINQHIKGEFEIQDEDVMNGDLLIDYNIKPRDVLELLSKEELVKFCENVQISTRGHAVGNILEAYKDSESLYLENFESIAIRDHNTLKENGITLKDADLGIKFETLTKSIFQELGFHVDENLRKTINTKKDKVDIVLTVAENEVILVECKTSKDKNYNKFSSVSRQLKSYYNLAKSNGLVVRRVILIGPDFTDDFINECGMEIELEISLLKARSLRKILESFRQSKHKKFPDVLLTRDLLVQEERIIKAIAK